MNDVYEALIESVTPVVRSAPEGVEVLTAQRERLHQAGATFIGGGLHPDTAFGEVVHVETARYQAIRDAMRGLVTRMPTAALHVHVGMPDPETAIAVCNRLRAHLPLLQALSASSPYWHGLDSGFASARHMTFRAFPRSAIPPTFASWEHYTEVIRWALADGRPARLQLPVVGPAPEPAARHGRGARDGRAVAARERRRPRGARPRARRSLRRRRGGVRPADRGADGVLVPRRPRRRRRDGLVAR